MKKKGTKMMSVGGEEQWLSVMLVMEEMVSEKDHRYKSLCQSVRKNRLFALSSNTMNVKHSGRVKSHFQVNQTNPRVQYYLLICYTTSLNSLFICRSSTMISSIKTLSILLSVFFFLFPSGTGLYSRTLTVTNKCTYTVWPAVLSGIESSPLPTTSLALQPGDSNTLPVPPAWSGRLWGRTLCSINITGKFSCVTGDCGTSEVECTGRNPTSPVTLVEFHFDSMSQMNLYDISLVEGFNLPVRVAPTGGKCLTMSCLEDLNSACPTELKVMRNGEAVGCKNTCETEPCLNSLLFKTACSDAHVYPHDDAFVTCSSSHYTITFCPTKSWSKAENEKEPAGKNVAKYTVVLAVISVICGLIIFQIRLRLSNRDWEFSFRAGTIELTPQIASNA
ncbi:pathogenesis-related thaumatin-like protein 3.5 [Vigna umbellata]|uniref:pathogenesis-related thaumatin-like protein 3.5 n=1 Tax=Vigna umbellata TaxID=87088 RepID=UPI001F5E8161|nr:pathogenesis-related thaumatin-like protein 3.5 [Vigna umbellata]